MDSSKRFRFFELFLLILVFVDGGIFHV